MNIDFDKHAIDFFKKFSHNINSNYEYDFESDALTYVKKQNDFRYKDRVEGDTLVMILENLEYLKFQKKINDKRYHIITQKGIEFW
jgi:hypothetical protein